MELKQICVIDDVCNQVRQIPGVRFVGIINKKGRKIAGGFSNKVSPLEKDEQKIEMLFMEIALDLSMRKDFDNSLGSINAIVSYRDKANIITIPYQENLILLSTEPELDTSKMIRIVQEKITFGKYIEVISQ
ncbi:hypothetical protein NZNM25_10030 [Nitrosopumilus zosterae]|uniref:Roadblock/LAMTOR2 domain-containing protein n=1 Tax=Nitrosopumilus zosterae TaxID=718286 RepID=A0A2S2KRB8_9ARCH|nr:DUF6659 family protein [Nitrosopumilus zosterae]BDQ30355.1 hypothetical protein NZOSNM25_000457 [Nitrosopumilus zosterae]GBH34212.1 hypothetical protein NZNM25_10030 [Nitrosopumilus zosterae]